MSARQRKLRMELMEARELMAVTPVGNIETGGVYDPGPSGDVAAYVQNGNLYINESPSSFNSDNGVRIAQLTNGMIRVMGTEANNSTGHVSTINGYAYQDFVVNGGLYMNLKGGNDRVQIGFSDGAGSPTLRDVSISTAAPEPVLTARSFGAGSIFNAPDDDQIMFWTGNIRNGVSINTGAGSDWVFFGKATIGDGLGADNLYVNTGAGSDNVTLKGATVRGNLDIQTYSSLAENDSDTVYFDDNFGTRTFVSGNINVRTGGGADGVYATDPGDADYSVFWLGVESLGSMSIDTGAGDDVGYLRNIRVNGNFSYYAGSGADSLDMKLTPIDPSYGTGAAVDGNVYIQMFSAYAETDADTVFLNEIGAGRSMWILTGGGNDILKLFNATVFDDLLFDLGAGNDSADLNNVLGVDNFFALLGEGDDSLTTMNLYQPIGLARIDGGAGYDRLVKSGAYPTRVDQTSWEVINGRRHDWLYDVLPKVKAFAAF